MNKPKYNFLMMLVPFIGLVLLAGLMIRERAGLDYEISYPPMEFLPPSIGELDANIDQSEVETLIFYDSSDEAADEHVQTVTDALDSMRVQYDMIDIDKTLPTSFLNYKYLVFSFLDWNKISAFIAPIYKWAEDGGAILFSIRPDPTATFETNYRKLGIISLSPDLVLTRGVTFETDLFPGTQNSTVATNLLEHLSYPVELELSADVHLTSGDNRNIPIVWEYQLGDGKLVVLNSDQFTTKVSRGIIGTAYSLLYDVFAYPVINSSMFYIDDFPSPVPAGTNEAIIKDYNRNIEGFYTNVWWPDLQSLAANYDIKFTGTIIETYEDQTVPPFSKQITTEKFRYFGGLLFDGGGEIGLHGYNHVPLCLKDAGKNQTFNYPVWPSTEAMELSIYELYSYSSELFPDNTFNTYVPPSNVLCDDVRVWLPKAIPDLRVIASVYFPDADKIAYEQEFEEKEDGIIELPRLTSGYEFDEFMWWSLVNELALHYVSSHFVHPADGLHVIEEYKSWEYYKTSIEEVYSWLKISAPGLRPMTSREGGMAVQRFDRIVVHREYKNDSYILNFDNFYDEVQLLMRSSKTPTSIDGGTITAVTSSLYLINATQSSVTINFSE